MTYLKRKDSVNGVISLIKLKITDNFGPWMITSRPNSRNIGHKKDMIKICINKGLEQGTVSRRV